MVYFLMLITSFKRKKYSCKYFIYQVYYLITIVTIQFGLLNNHEWEVWYTML